MERYSEYKDSGVKWLGEIPRHWEVIKTSRVFSYIGSGTTPKSGSEEYYTQNGVPFLQTGDLNDGYVADTSKRITEKALRDTNLKIYPKGSLIVAMYGATIGKIGILNIDSTVNQACCVLTKSPIIETKFAFYTFLAAKKDLIFQSKGGGQPNISQDTIRNERIPVPPLKEQKAIANYLDAATSKIDEAIGQQQKMIDLLNERKQIIINNAVTKGLDPNVPMKDSGVEWIGEIPEHWEIKPLKYCARTNSGSTPRTISGKDNPMATIKWVRTTDLKNCHVCDTTEYLTLDEVKSSSCPLLQKGTVLISMYGGEGSFGKLGLLDVEATINQALCSINCFDNIMPEYIFYYLQTIHPLWMKYAASTRKDPNLNQETIRNISVVLPPLNEQKLIVNKINLHLNQIDTILNNVIKQISLLQERKQIIINDVVTGKVKVV